MATDAAAARQVALTADQRKTVRAIVERWLPGARAFVFGSRATGRARPFSDLDLLIVEPASLSLAQRADLRDAFEASDLPFRVDVVEAQDLPPETAGRVAAESVFLGDV